MRAIRAFGGVAGAMLAAAGGIGAAVGLYTLPAPQSGSVAAEAYAQVAQRAFAASTLRADEFGSTVLRVEVRKGATKLGGHADTESGEPNTNVYQDAGVELRAEVRTCSNEGQCFTDAEWRGFIPDAAFQFSPAMDAAGVDAQVQGCRFRVVWHPEGAIVPFEGHNLESASAGGENPGSPWRANGGARVRAFAELSRTARADITLSPAPSGTCDPYVRSGAPAYLTQGGNIDPASAGFDVR